MPSASVQAIPIPQNPMQSHHRRTRSQTAAPAVAAASQLPLSLSPPASSSMAVASVPTAASYGPSTSKASTSTSLDINIRDFFPEGDATLLKFMDEASIIRAQREALEALNDAALSRALRESEEMAAKEAEKRRKEKGKEKLVEDDQLMREEEEEASLVAREGVAISMGGGGDASEEINVPEEFVAPVPAVDAVTREGEGYEGSSAPFASSSPQIPDTAATMTMPLSVSPPGERYSADEVAARLLAREWRVASLQGALFANPDMMPPPPTPTQHVPPTVSSSTSPPSSSSFPPSTSSSASAAARKATSPTRAVPMTIPAEAFYSRSTHHRQGSTSRSSTSSSSSSAKSSPPPSQTSFMTPDPKSKPLPPRVYTSASSAAAARAATKSTSHTEKARASPTQTSFGSVYASSSQPQPTSSASTSHSGAARALRSSRHAPAEASLPRKSVSPEGPRTTMATGATGSTAPSAAAVSVSTSASHSEKKVTSGHKAHASASSISSKVQSTSSNANANAKTSNVPEKPRSSPSPSPGISPSSSQASPVTTSASKVAAAAEKEKEKARIASAKHVSTSSSTSSASASAVVAKHATAASPSRPVLDREASSSTPSPSTSSSSSPVLKSTTVVETNPPLKAVTPLRDAEELFSAPAKKEPVVVPISSLSESDDEDDSDEDADDDDDDDNDDEDEDSEDEDETIDNKDLKGDAETETVPFHGLYTANRSCSKCGESILSPRNTLPLPADSFLHISCPKCATLHCRGCSAPAKCPKNCTGSKSCVIKDCCPQVRAIAIFEALSTFDHEFLAEAGPSGSHQRDEYIQAMISRPLTAQTKKLGTTFVRSMTTLTEIFNSDPPLPERVSSSVAELFERSLMPEVIHGFLRNTNVKVWITHCEIYCAILDLLRYMIEGGFGGIMAVPLRRVEVSCGLKEWVWGRGEIVWVSEFGSEREREKEREEEQERKGRDMWRGQLRGGAEKPVGVVEKGEKGREMGVEEVRCASAVPLKNLIMGLETHNGSLLELLDKVTFAPTVVKLNALSDGISQLVLGQVLGI